MEVELWKKISTDLKQYQELKSITVQEERNKGKTEKNVKVQKRVKTPLNVQTPKLKLNQFKQYVKQQVCGNLTYANIRN